MIAILLAASAVASGLSLPLGRFLCRRGLGWMLAIVPVGLVVGFVSLYWTIESGLTVTERFAWAPSLDVDFTLRLDGFSYLFCLLVTGVGALVVIYADAYLAEREPRERARFLSLVLCFMTAMLGTVLADNLLVLFLFWEATSLFSFLLIGFDVDSASARRSALMALHVTAGRWPRPVGRDPPHRCDPRQLFTGRGHCARARARPESVDRADPRRHLHRRLHKVGPIPIPLLAA